MRIVVAVDSFKGSLTSVEAGQAIRDGILRANHDAEVLVCPIADGGEGTVLTLVDGMSGALRQTEVTGPLGEPVLAQWGILDGKSTCAESEAFQIEDARVPIEPALQSARKWPTSSKTAVVEMAAAAGDSGKTAVIEMAAAAGDSGKTAVIEMAAAAGLTLVEPAKRNPLFTTTYGVGELIGEAMREGCRHFIIGIGGSATNDGGVGMLQALGFDFRDAAGRPISRGAIGLAELCSISDENVNPMLKNSSFRIVCDVQNPLCGPNGCSHVFGPQKGASAGQIEEMDAWLLKYAQIVGSRGDPDMPGAGAAGGLGFAFSAFTNAKLERGIDIIMDETGLEEKIQTADLVITGEGRIDAQTYMGKAPAGVAALARKYGKRVIAFCGSATEAAKDCQAHGIEAVYPTMPEGMSLEEAMKRDCAMANLTKKAEEVFRNARLGK